MKITILNDTSRNTNWGCAATMNGLRHALMKVFDQSTIDSLELQPLPYKKIKLLRNRAEGAVAKCLMDPRHSTAQLVALLKNLNFDFRESLLPDLLVLNGEGGIHSKSGHLVRFLGIAKLFKELGVKVLAVNQSVDLDIDSRYSRVVKAVYNELDFVSVREPVSLRLIHQIGVPNAVLVPDAAFSVEPVNDEVENRARSELELPERYVCLTGSSDITKRAGSKFLQVYESLKQVAGLPVIMMASTKTDRALARILTTHDPSVKVITDAYDYRTAVAVISGAELLVGGRFHPIIFAARQGTAVVPFKGNTHKMEGLMELLSYPVAPVDWNRLDDCQQQIDRVLNNRQALATLLSVNSEKLSGELNRFSI